MDILITERLTETQLLDENINIDVGDHKDYQDIVSNSEVTVSINIQDGPDNTYEWSDGEDDARGLQISIRSDSITFEPFVR